jgi:hypothetical protein
MLRWKKFFTHERNSITSLGNILQVTFNFLGSTSICICWTIVAMWHESQYGGAMLGLIQGSNKILFFGCNGLRNKFIRVHGNEQIQLI